MNELPHLSYSTNDNPTASVIWLHGLGASGHDFYGIVPELKLPESLGVRFLFPHAPERPVTINNGLVMPAWYDILALTHERKLNHEHLQQSAHQIKAMVQSEIDKGIASQRILVVGFSQGGAVALEVALSFEQPLGGLMALSTYFATQNTVQLSPSNQQIPIEVHHGLYDPTVPESLGQAIKDSLMAKGYSAIYRTYPMEHNVCLNQIKDIREFIIKCLAT